MQEENKKAYDFRAWNILAFMILFLLGGTLGTTIILLPLFIYAIRLAFRAFSNSVQTEDM
jgi:hypothetical protein